MDDKKEIVAQRLKELLKSRALSQSELAEKCSLTKDAVSKIINGKMALSVPSALKIANTFGVSLDYLFGLTDYENATELAISLIEQQLTFDARSYSLERRHILSTIFISSPFDDYRNAVYQAHGMSDETVESILAKEKGRLLVSMLKNVSDLEKHEYALVPLEHINDELATKLDDEQRWYNAGQNESE